MNARTIARLINFLFWTAVWLGVVWWTDEFWHWIPMSAEAVIVALPALFIHIAFRTEAPEQSI